MSAYCLLQQLSAKHYQKKTNWNVKPRKIDRLVCVSLKKISYAPQILYHQKTKYRWFFIPETGKLLPHMNKTIFWESHLQLTDQVCAKLKLALSIPLDIRS